MGYANTETKARPGHGQAAGNAFSEVSRRSPVSEEGQRQSVAPGAVNDTQGRNQADPGQSQVATTHGPSIFAEGPATEEAHHRDGLHSKEARASPPNPFANSEPNQLLAFPDDDFKA